MLGKDGGKHVIPPAETNSAGREQVDCSTMLEKLGGNECC